MSHSDQPVAEERDVLRLVVITILFVIVASTFIMQLFAYLNSRDALHQAHKTNTELRHTNTQLRKTNDKLRRLVAANYKLALQGKQAHDVQCAQRNNLREQIEFADAFLKAHPEGFGTLSADEIRVANERQRKFLRSYRKLVCPADKKKAAKP